MELTHHSSVEHIHSQLSAVDAEAVLLILGLQELVVPVDLETLVLPVLQEPQIKVLPAVRRTG
jgi:hypothetical protein